MEDLNKIKNKIKALLILGARTDNSNEAKYARIFAQN
jgi:hypothetical protein